MNDDNPLDAGFARLAALAEARSLPGVTRSTGDGTQALKVGAAPFVHMLDSTTAVLQCPADQKVLLMDISPDLYFETEQYVGQDAMLIRLDRITDEELSLRLHDAWTFMAPEKLKRSRS